MNRGAIQLLVGAYFRNAGHFLTNARGRIALALVVGAAAMAPGVLYRPSAASADVATPKEGTHNETLPKPQAEAASLKQEAVNVARQIADSYPDEALAYALLGSAYYNTGKAEDATEYLQKCVQLSPDQAEAYGVLARVAYEKGNLEESIRLGGEALKRGPGNPEVLNQLGRAFMDLGHTDEAIDSLQKATQVPDAPSQSFYLLGQAYLQGAKYAEAKSSFQRAIALLPDHTQAFFGLFTACLKLGQADEAQRYRDRFLVLEAADRRSHNERSSQEDTLTGLPTVRATVARTFFGAGQIYRIHQQPAKAAELFKKAVALDEDNMTYRAAIESFYVQQKAPADGAAFFEQLTAEQPKNGLNYLFLGRLRSRMDQVDAAEQAYKKLVELAPQWPDGYRALAELELRTNRNVAEARRLAQKLVELDPTGQNYYFLGFACAKNNDRAGAIQAIKQAVAIAPGEKRYRDLLQQLENAP